MVGTFPFYLGSMLVYIICLVGKGMTCHVFFCLFVRETWFSVRCSFSCILCGILWLRFMFGIAHPANLTIVLADENDAFSEPMRHYSILIDVSGGQ